MGRGCCAILRRRGLQATFIGDRLTSWSFFFLCLKTGYRNCGDKALCYHHKANIIMSSIQESFTLCHTSKMLQFVELNISLEK